jgi:hypothetical protein
MIELAGARHEVCQLACQASPLPFTLRDHPGRSLLFECARVPGLMIVGGAGERDQDGRLAGCSYLGHGAGAGACQDYICIRELLVEAREKCLNSACHPRLRVSTAHIFERLFARLVRQAQLRAKLF